MVLSNYKNKNANLILNENEKIQVTPISQYRSKELQENQNVIIAKKLSGNDWQILEVMEVSGPSLKLSEVLNIQTVWSKMMAYWSEGIPANNIEIFISKPRKKRIEFPVSMKPVRIDFKALPGVYLFPK